MKAERAIIISQKGYWKEALQHLNSGLMSEEEKELYINSLSLQIAQTIQQCLTNKD